MTTGRFTRLFIIALAMLWALAAAIPAQESEGEPLATSEEGEVEPMGPRTTNFAIREGSLGTTLHIVERDLGVVLQPRGAAAEQVLRDFFVRDATLDDLLGRLHGELGWQWYQDDSMPPNVYELYTDEDFRAMVLPNLVIEKAFYFQNLPAERAAEFIEPMLSEVGSLFVSPRTNEVIVTDLPQFIEAIERLRDRTDVNLYIRIFNIRHADPVLVADALERMLSPEGTLEVDERNRTLIVEDLYRNIRRMDIIVERLDIATELRTYEINYVVEEDLDALIAALERIITPDAFLEVEERTGLILIDDVEEVHEKAEQIIAAYDRPTRQIMLQLDLIQVRTENEVQVDTEFTLADDIFQGATAIGPDGTSPLPGFPFIASDTNLNDTYPVFGLGGGGMRFEFLSNDARALLSASLTNTDTRILLSPRLQVKDKHEATIEVGGEVPFLTTTFDDDSNTRSTTQQAVREGLRLVITPTITNTGYVEMDIALNNDDANVVQRNAGGGSEQVDVVDRRTQQVETVLVIPDGGTRVIAGLLTSGSSESRSGTPFLSEIPYIGWLFGSSTNSDARDNLMIFITPTIIVESAHDYEWRPFYDERPVSSRFAEPTNPNFDPLYPDDLSLIAPSVINREAELEDYYPVDSPWMDDFTFESEMSSGEAMQDEMDYLNETMGEPHETLSIGASTERNFSSSATGFSIPLVSEDLHEANAAAVMEEGEGPSIRTSFTQTGPSASGTMPSTGSGSNASSGNSGRNERPPANATRNENTNRNNRNQNNNDEERTRREAEQRDRIRAQAERETNYR